MEPDPLCGHLLLRSVNREPYQRRKLTNAQKSLLVAAAGDALSIEWLESGQSIRQMARLSARATDIRLRMPEAYQVHRRVIDWSRRFSPDGMPSGALGLWKLSLPLMRWAMDSWPRMQRMNRWTGTGMARVQLDYVPGRASAAWFTMRTPESATAPEPRATTLLRTGQHIQRFWLQATSLGLAMQPAMAILIFADRAEQPGPAFTSDIGILRDARDLARAVRQTCGRPAADYVFLGRIGAPFPRLPLYRSVRLGLWRLIMSRPPSQPRMTSG